MVEGRGLWWKEVPQVFSSLLPSVRELCHAIGDGPEVLQACPVNFPLVLAAGFDVLQEVRGPGEDDVIGQDGGSLGQEVVGLQQLQIWQVAALPVVHEDKVCLEESVLLFQLGDNIFRSPHDELHLAGMDGGNRVSSSLARRRASQIKPPPLGSKNRLARGHK